ncbi:conjugal transfer protein [Risungbinella massiliensis]|uniref:conjugal transfer protein n=1 Tax=Risungbinella massiliensis TaxID=1329796 RepID=UPI0005CBA664|nr:conjugal transfer protein [Risungbinella massiliensis]
MSPSKRKLFRILFWTLLSYTALSTTIVWAIQLGLIPTFLKQTPVASQQVTNSNNPDVWSESTFAERFTREFLWWNVGSADSRKERLKDYLASNIDVEGGLDTDAADYHSLVDAVNVWKIQDREGAKGVKEVTVQAELTLTNVENSNDKKRAVYQLVIPIMRSGSSYRVVDKPYFVSMPVGGPLNAQKEEAPKGEVVTEEVRLKVDQFLGSFWENYFTGKVEELNYFVRSKEPITGYENRFQFVEMRNLKVLKQESGFVAYGDVTLKDKNSGFESTVRYKLGLLQEGDRWYVTQIRQGEV